MTRWKLAEDDPVLVKVKQCLIGGYSMNIDDIHFFAEGDNATPSHFVIDLTEEGLDLIKHLPIAWKEAFIPQGDESENGANVSVFDYEILNRTNSKDLTRSLMEEMVREDREKPYEPVGTVAKFRKLIAQTPTPVFYYIQQTAGAPLSHVFVCEIGEDNSNKERFSSTVSNTTRKVRGVDYNLPVTRFDLKVEPLMHLWRVATTDGELGVALGTSFSKNVKTRLIYLDDPSIHSPLEQQIREQMKPINSGDSVNDIFSKGR